MAKRTKFPKGTPDSVFDVFEAIKRALIHRGLFRQKTSKIKKKPKLADVAKLGHEILFKTSTVFPFTLFPDTVILDREKVTFITRYFFAVAKVTGIPIRDLLNVEVDTGPFFGSVHTASRFFLTTPFSIRFLWRSDAIKLHRLLQGYIIANEQEIDCSKIEKQKLIRLLSDLGTGHTR